MATSWERDTSLEKERFPHVHRKIHPPWMMATGIVSSKLADCTERPSQVPPWCIWSSRRSEDGMRQRTFQASTVAFLLGLAMSLAWSFLHASGL
jgi:hypothetical protein